MRHIKTSAVWLISIVIFIGGTVQRTIAFVNQENRLSLQVKTIKPVFTLGEIVNLDVIFQNISNRDIYIAKNPIDSESIKILVSKNGERYRRYAYGGKVGADLGPLKPGETNAFQKSIIYNPAPDYSNLNADAAKGSDELDRRILTDYAFPEAGAYSIKVISYYTNPKDKNNIYKPDISVESQPIRINIIEPVGENKEIWNFIKDKPEYAFFMQFDELLYGAEKQIKFRQESEHLMAKYPNSFIVGQMKQSMEKFKENEAKRKESLEKMIRQPNRPE